jgi:hypothetical protein
MPQLQNIDTRVVYGSQSDDVWIESSTGERWRGSPCSPGAHNHCPPASWRLSTPFTRGEILTLAEANARHPGSTDVAIIAPHGNWWHFPEAFTRD